MGTDIRSILRVGLANKSVTADTAILAAEDISRKQPDDEDVDYIKSNMTVLVCWTIEYSPSVVGNLSVIFNDGTSDYESIIDTGEADKMHIVEFFMPVDWPVNFKYSENATMSLLCVSEHGGIY